MQQASEIDRTSLLSSPGERRPSGLWLPWVLTMALVGAIFGMVGYAFHCGIRVAAGLPFLIAILLAGVGFGVIQLVVVKSAIPNPNAGFRSRLAGGSPGSWPG